MQDTPNGDIFADVADTEVPASQSDPTKQLYLLPEGVDWFVPKLTFGAKPKDVKECTASVVVRFLSWQIQEAFQSVYLNTGNSAPGVLRDQLIVRYHPIPDGYGDTTGEYGRAPCMTQFGETCAACTERTKAEKRFTRDNQPANYFRDVIAKLKAKDKTLMLGQVWETDENGVWVPGKIMAFEFPNFVRNGRTMTQMLHDRTNDADKRFRMDRKSFAGYVKPVAVRLVYSWPNKDGKPLRDQYSSWALTELTPFPAEGAGGPDVSTFTKEWAVSIAGNDPASWINRGAFPKLFWPEVAKWVYGVFTGEISTEEAVDLDTADFVTLLNVVMNNPKKFDGVLDTTDYSHDMIEALRAAVKGVLNG